MPEVYFHQYVVRLEAIEALDKVVRGILPGDALATIRATAGQMGSALGDASTQAAYGEFAEALQAMDHLVRWADAYRTAQVDADRFLRAAKQVARDVSRRPGTRPPALSSALDAIQAITTLEEVEEIARKLLRVPLPLPAHGSSHPRRTLPKSASKPVESTVKPAAAFLAFRLNGAPMTDGHVLQANVLYDLDVDARFSRWPAGAGRIELIPIDVELAGTVFAPTYTLEPPSDLEQPFARTIHGRLRLMHSQPFLARPLELKYVAQLHEDANDVAAERSHDSLLLQGQYKLLFESYDPRVNPLTGFSNVDARLRELRNEARQYGIADAELADFLTIVASAGRIAALALADNAFPGVWSEAQFHENVRSRLRTEPHIASDLEDHPKAAGGITDLSYRRIRIELKADDLGQVNVDTASQRYGAQAAQYAAGSDRRCAVLIVLDTEAKTSAPANVQNDLAIKVAPANGANRETLLGVIVVRGNLARPSDLSKNG